MTSSAASGPTRKRGIPPAPIPGFDHVQRYWDRTGSRVIARLKPGEFYVTSRDEILTTTLGSCVAACIHDPRQRVGGMNHFMLPQHVEGGRGNWDITDPNSANRYGSFAMESLINTVLALGSRRQDLEFKLFGAGRVLRLDIDVSARNMSFVREYMQREGLRVAASDLGGELPLTVRYLPLTGQAFIKRLHDSPAQIGVAERRYLERIDQQPISGDMEFF